MHSPGKLARVVPKWKTSLRCFQILKEEVHNDFPVIGARLGIPGPKIPPLASLIRPAPA